MREALKTHRVALAIAQSARDRASRSGSIAQHGGRRCLTPHTIRSLGVEAPGKAYFFDYEEGPPADGHVRLDTLYTGFSAGTELTF